MKFVLAAIGGFGLTLATYVAGFTTAIFFLNAEPASDRLPGLDSEVVWSTEPVEIEPAAQNFDRLPARPLPKPSIEAAAQPRADEAEATPSVVELVDTTTTGAIEDETSLQDKPDPAPSMHSAHVQWCSERYRSYRPGDNSYTPYSGGARECVSPFSQAAAGSDAGDAGDGYVEISTDRPMVGYATEDEPGSHLAPDHVDSCFARYRSYRPEDNTYQPYGGGPRRQCR